MTRLTFTDQLGREISLNHPPKRIVSLVPSQTELLFDLGLDKEVVGITKFCVHPPGWKKEKMIVGGTKKLHFDKILQLQPDLIIANKEENNKEDIERQQPHFPVWVSEVATFEQALEMISRIGLLVGKGEASIKLTDKISNAFLDLAQFRQKIQLPQISAAYFIWQDPFLVAGGDTFINEMMRLASFENIFESEARYPEVQVANHVDCKAEVIFLSSEPYPFAEKHVGKFQNLFPKSKIILVNGEFFSWYGSRMLQAAEYFKTLLSQHFYNQPVNAL